jgi:hypothetical protein
MNTLRGGTLFIGILFALTASGFSDAQEPSEGAPKGPKAAVQKGEREPKVTIEQAI